MNNNHFSELASKFFLMAALVILPIRPVMLAVGVLICADFVTGVWASIKCSERITSAKLKLTINKMVAYQMGIIAGFILETWLVPEIPFIRIVAGTIGMIEGKSLFENIAHITGIDILPLIIKKLQGGDFADLLKTEPKKPDLIPTSEK